MQASPELVKRASASDVATVGYATLNGGFVISWLWIWASLWYGLCIFRTTGGSGGTTTTVTTLDALTTAVTGATKKIVIISGTITGDAVVKVGNNTSVLGKSGACTFFHLFTVQLKV
jgi:pectate lyase